MKTAYIEMKIMLILNKTDSKQQFACIKITLENTEGGNRKRLVTLGTQDTGRRHKTKSTPLYTSKHK